MSSPTMHADLATLLLRRRPGHTLEQPFYTSPAVLDAELDLIFGRHWIFVGQEPDVPEPGDVNAITVGDTKILIVRADDGQVRAFHNVCRHRGAQLVPEGRSTVGNLVCRYHTWTYGLDGDLLFADHMGDDFDRGCHGLRPIALRSLEGLLFICLAANPPDDFDAMEAEIAPYLAPHGLRDSRVAFQTDLVEDGNWKLTMENNRECYHCSSNHPELTVPLFAYGFGYAPQSVGEDERADVERYETLVATSHRDWERQGIPSRLIEKLSGTPTGYRTERLVLDRDGESHTADTRVACSRLMGNLREKRLGGLHVWTQPNSWHHLMSDHAITFCVLPIGPDKTLLRTTWLVHKDAVEGVDYDLGNLTAVWQATNRQDSDLVGIAQAGVSSAGYVPGPYSPHTEMLVEEFAAWYVERMTAGLRA